MPSTKLSSQKVAGKPLKRTSSRQGGSGTVSSRNNQVDPMNAVKAAELRAEEAEKAAAAAELKAKKAETAAAEAEQRAAAAEKVVAELRAAAAPGAAPRAAPGAAPRAASRAEAKPAPKHEVASSRAANGVTWRAPAMSRKGEKWGLNVGTQRSNKLPPQAVNPPPEDRGEFLRKIIEVYNDAIATQNKFIAAKRMGKPRDKHHTDLNLPNLLADMRGLKHNLSLVEKYLENPTMKIDPVVKHNWWNASEDTKRTIESAKEWLNLDEWRRHNVAINEDGLDVLTLKRPIFRELPAESSRK